MTVPVDPGTGLLDGVDYVYLAGASGLHARFLQLYKTLDPAQIGIQSDNILMSGNFPWTGTHSHTQNTKYADNKGLADTNGNEILQVLATGSAVNQTRITNAATGNDPVFEATGDDSSVGLTIQGKGTKIVKLKAARTGYVDLGNTGTGTVTADLSTGNVFKMTATGNFTLAYSNPSDGQRVTFIIKQDGTGSRTITWPTKFRWLNGTGAADSTTDKPTLTTTANKLDIISGMYDATADIWWMSVVGFKGAIS